METSGTVPSSFTVSRSKPCDGMHSRKHWNMYHWGLIADYALEQWVEGNVMSEPKKSFPFSTDSSFPLEWSSKTSVVSDLVSVTCMETKSIASASLPPYTFGSLKDKNRWSQKMLGWAKPYLLLKTWPWAKTLLTNQQLNAQGHSRFVIRAYSDQFVSFTTPEIEVANRAACLAFLFVMLSQIQPCSAWSSKALLAWDTCSTGTGMLSAVKQIATWAYTTSA